MAIKLNTREKISVGAAVVAIILFLFCQFFLFPLMDKNKQLNRLISTRENELAEIRQLRSTYMEAAGKTDQTKRLMRTRKKGFTLFSFLESLAGKTGVKGNIAYMKPTTSSQKDSPYRLSMVEMKLQEVNMSQLLAYLHGIETSRDMLVIKRLSISKSDRTADAINTIFQVETLEM